MTREERQIPKAVIELADKNSCNKVSYAGYLAEYGNIYSIWAEDEDGMSIPLGLPLYIIEKQSDFTVFVDEYFEISDAFNS